MGPDFSQVDSREKAERMASRGELERLLLLPTAFGGSDVPANVVFVPVGMSAAKAHIDLGIIAELVKSGTVRRYEAIPKYQGASHVPISIQVRAWDPGDFSSTIAIWGEALSK